MAVISVVIASDTGHQGEAIKKIIDKAPDVFKVLDVILFEKILEVVGDYQPEIIVCTLREWEENIDVLSEIKNVCPQTLVVMITEKEDPEVVLHALKAGVDSCLGSITPGYILRSLEMICRSGIMIFPRMLKPRIQRIADLSEYASKRIPEELTGREREIYSLLLKRYSNKEISQQLFISESTVKVHVRNILQKIGTKSRVSLIDN
ncbi:response regulator transcription factor [Pelotomaculum isophthalicicum JI]|uniref:Stage 0 sporulation protein A homolog n=1 Tax=Pelotomaculum isophthalicicum JI TaxID=947010 RepID=A0A9X4H676_9FIRM|nr:response regulator transcription factor [Pelotomaculum isophthalicicum]MDF9409002.1 response regulator transcription factor [Pelotomaculum isophthalicicum JI]